MTIPQKNTTVLVRAVAKVHTLETPSGACYDFGVVDCPNGCGLELSIREKPFPQTWGPLLEDLGELTPLRKGINYYLWCSLCGKTWRIIGTKALKVAILLEEEKENENE